MKETGREKAFFLAAAAAAAGIALWAFWGKVPPSVQNFSYYADRGELLFHAAADKAASFSMPLPSLAAAAASHLGFDPSWLARLAGLLLCLPAYALGARGGGRARGAVFALAAALAGLTCASPEAEQALYSLLLLLFLDLELKRQAAGGAGAAALAGLAAGFTLLVRSPLFAFPPLAALFQYFSLKPGLRTWLVSTAVFLACAWLVLVPWARLNHSLFGKTILFEEGRPACNVITGASGIVFTIEGDARAFAGLSREESVYPWAVKTVLENPGRYALAVARRLGHVLLMFPVLFLLAGAGLFLGRRRTEARFLAFFSAYFILIHCLLSIEERYFQPLRYALALLAAGGAWELLKKIVPDTKPGRDYFTPPLFALAALAAALTLGITWRYPAAARAPLIAAELELKKYPGDPWLHKKKGEALLALDLTARGLASLEQACALSGAADLCYITSALKASAPAEPPQLENRYELLLAKLARELELGRMPEARAAYGAALEIWRSEKNSIKGPPRAEDAGHLARLKETNRTFWDLDLAAALTCLPLEKRAGALRRLAALTPLTPKLRALELGWAAGLTAAEKRELGALRRELARDLPQAEAAQGAAARELAAELLSGKAPPVGTGGELELLLALRLDPPQTVLAFDTHCRSGCGPAARAAAEAFLSGGADRLAAARRLTAADPGNFAYALILLEQENFSAPALAAAAERLKTHPYPLAAGALAWTRRGDSPAAVRLARAAAAAGRLGEQGWAETLHALQEAKAYGEGLAAAARALREHPRSSMLLNNRGVLRSLSGDGPGALKDFEAAAAAGPENFSALMNLGAALENSGNRAAAAQAYGRAERAAFSDSGRLDAGRALARARKPA